VSTVIHTRQSVLSSCQSSVNIADPGDNVAQPSISTLCHLLPRIHLGHIDAVHDVGKELDTCLRHPVLCGTIRVGLLSWFVRQAFPPSLIMELWANLRIRQTVHHRLLVQEGRTSQAFQHLSSSHSWRYTTVRSPSSGRS
jgi:hypothetical protein